MCSVMAISPTPALARRLGVRARGAPARRRPSSRPLAVRGAGAGGSRRSPASSSARARSSAVVTLRLRGSPSTQITRPPARSTSEAQSVAAASAPAACSIAARSRSTGKPCGVCTARSAPRSKRLRNRCRPGPTPLHRVGHRRAPGTTPSAPVAPGRHDAGDRAPRRPAGGRRRAPARSARSRAGRPARSPPTRPATPRPARPPRSCRRRCRRRSGSCRSRSPPGLPRRCRRCRRGPRTSPGTRPAASARRSFTNALGRSAAEPLADAGGDDDRPRSRGHASSGEPAEDHLAGRALQHARHLDVDRVAESLRPASITIIVPSLR